MSSRYLLGAGVVVMLASVPLFPSIGAFTAIAGLVLLLAGVVFARR